MRDYATIGHVWLGVADDESTALFSAIDAAFASRDRPRLDSPALILPAHSTLGAGSLANALRTALSSFGIVTGMQNPSSLIEWRPGTTWRTIPLARLEVRLRDVRLPATIADASNRILLTSVAGSRPVPIALDALARYTYPRLRLMIRAASVREALAVEVNAAIRPDLVVIGACMSRWYIVAVSADLIAAELFGLALREEPLLSSLELSTPWEDPLVQRATELDLGVNLPSQLRIHVSGPTPDEVASTLHRMKLRLGMAVGRD